MVKLELDKAALDAKVSRNNVHLAHMQGQKVRLEVDMPTLEGTGADKGEELSRVPGEMTENEKFAHVQSLLADLVNSLDEALMALDEKKTEQGAEEAALTQQAESVRYQLDAENDKLTRHDRRVTTLQEEKSWGMRKNGAFGKDHWDYSQNVLECLLEELMGHLTAPFELWKGQTSCIRILLGWSIMTVIIYLETTFGSLQSYIEKVIVNELPGAFCDELPTTSDGPSTT